ncbi:MAG: Rho termination factor N-terminal domain-containing protein, partial [Gordonibacter sp.]
MSDATVTESAAPAKTPVRRRSTSVATGKTTARAAKAEAPKDAEQKKPAARKQAARAAKPAQPSDTNGSQPAQPSSAGDSKPAQGTGTKPAQGTGTKPTQASNTRPVQTNNNANRPNNRPNNSRPNNNGGKQQGNNGSNQRRQRRPHNNNQGPREVQPSVSRDDLLKLKVAELRAKAEELGVDGTGLKKAELIEAVFSASVKAEGFIEVSGILDILADGYGFLRTQGYLPSETDCYVGLSTIRRNGLRKGDLVSGQTRPARENEKYAAI